MAFYKSPDPDPPESMWWVLQPVRETIAQLATAFSNISGIETIGDVPLGEEPEPHYTMRLFIPPNTQPEPPGEPEPIETLRVLNPFTLPPERDEEINAIYEQDMRGEITHAEAIQQLTELGQEITPELQTAADEQAQETVIELQRQLRDAEISQSDYDDNIRALAHVIPNWPELSLDIGALSPPETTPTPTTQPPPSHDLPVAVPALWTLFHVDVAAAQAIATRWGARWLGIFYVDGSWVIEIDIAGFAMTPPPPGGPYIMMTAELTNANWRQLNGTDTVTYWSPILL